jgi:hypothetical protein
LLDLGGAFEVLWVEGELFGINERCEWVLDELAAFCVLDFNAGGAPSTGNMENTAIATIN